MRPSPCKPLCIPLGACARIKQRRLQACPDELGIVLAVTEACADLKARIIAGAGCISAVTAQCVSVPCNCLPSYASNFEPQYPVSGSYVSDNFGSKFTCNILSWSRNNLTKLKRAWTLLAACIEFATSNKCSCFNLLKRSEPTSSTSKNSLSVKFNTRSDCSGSMTAGTAYRWQSVRVSVVRQPDSPSKQPGCRLRPCRQCSESCFSLVHPPKLAESILKSALQRLSASRWQRCRWGLPPSAARPPCR